MATQMLIRLNKETKDRLSRLARAEGKSMSQLVRELIEERIKERDIGAYVDDLWKRIGDKLHSKGITERDVKRAIRQSRKPHK